MGLPGHRRTSSHKHRRAAHFALDEVAYNLCPQCKKPVKMHHACTVCGTYKGKQVIDVTRKTARIAKKLKK